MSRISHLLWIAAFWIVAFLIVAGTAESRVADIENGKAVYEKCAACHALKAGVHDEAPSLAGVLGRKIAAVEEYRYSAAMRRANVVWTEAALDAFLEDPQVFIPGNRMAFDGLKDKIERDDLIAYIKHATAQEGAGGAERAGRVAGSESGTSLKSATIHMNLRHQSLVAWQRADDLFIALHQLARQAFPDSERRAAYSVPANIVEGFARRHRRARLERYSNGVVSAFRRTIEKSG